MATLYPNTAPVTLYPATEIPDDYPVLQSPNGFSTNVVRGLKSALVGADAGAAASHYYEAMARGDAPAARANGLRAQQLAMEAQRAAPRVQSIGNVHSVGDFGDWSAGVIGSLPVSAGPAIAGGLVGGALGGPVGARLGMRAAAGGSAGSMLGATGGMHPQMTDAARLQQMQAEAQGAPAMDPQQVLTSTSNQGLLQAGLESIVPGLAARSMLGHGAAAALTKPFSGAAKRIGRDVALDSAAAAGSEDIAMNFEGQRNPGRDTSGDQMRYWDAAAGEAIGGVAMGGAGHVADMAHTALGTGAQLGGDAAAYAARAGKQGAKAAWDARPQSWDEAAVMVGEGAANLHNQAEDVVTRWTQKGRDADTDVLLTPQKGMAEDELRADDANKHTATANLMAKLAAEPDKFPDYVHAAAAQYAQGSKTMDSWRPVADAVNDMHRSEDILSGANELLSERLAPVAEALGKTAADARNAMDDVVTAYNGKREADGRQNAMTPAMGRTIANERDDFSPILEEYLAPFTGLKTEEGLGHALPTLGHAMRNWVTNGFSMKKGSELVVPKSLLNMFDDPAEAVSVATKLMHEQGLIGDDALAKRDEVLQRLDVVQTTSKQAHKIVEDNLTPTARRQNTKPDLREMVNYFQEKLRTTDLDAVVQGPSPSSALGSAAHDAGINKAVMNAEALLAQATELFGPRARAVLDALRSKDEMTRDAQGGRQHLTPDAFDSQTALAEAASREMKASEQREYDRSNGLLNRYAAKQKREEVRSGKAAAYKGRDDEQLVDSLVGTLMRPSDTSVRQRANDLRRTGELGGMLGGQSDFTANGREQRTSALSDEHGSMPDNSGQNVIPGMDAEGMAQITSSSLDDEAGKPTVKYHHYSESRTDNATGGMKPPVPFQVGGVVKNKPDKFGKAVPDTQHDTAAEKRIAELHGSSSVEVKRQGYMDYLREKNADDRRRNVGDAKGYAEYLRENPDGNAKSYMEHLDTKEEDGLMNDVQDALRDKIDVLAKLQAKTKRRVKMEDGSTAVIHDPAEKVLNDNFYVLREEAQREKAESTNISADELGREGNQGQIIGNKWEEKVGKDGEYGTTAHGRIWLERVGSDGKPRAFATSASRVIDRMFKGQKADGSTEDIGGLAGQHAALHQGLASLMAAAHPVAEGAETDKSGLGKPVLTGRVGVKETPDGPVRWLRPAKHVRDENGKLHMVEPSEDFPDSLRMYSDKSETYGDAKVAIRGAADKKILTAGKSLLKSLSTRLANMAPAAKGRSYVIEDLEELKAALGARDVRVVDASLRKSEKYELGREDDGTAEIGADTYETKLVSTTTVIERDARKNLFGSKKAALEHAENLAEHGVSLRVVKRTESALGKSGEGSTAIGRARENASAQWVIERTTTGQVRNSAETKSGKPTTRGVQVWREISSHSSQVEAQAAYDAHVRQLVDEQGDDGSGWPNLRVSKMEGSAESVKGVTYEGTPGRMPKGVPADIAKRAPVASRAIGKATPERWAFQESQLLRSGSIPFGSEIGEMGRATEFRSRHEDGESKGVRNVDETTHAYADEELTAADTQHKFAREDDRQTLNRRIVDTLRKGVPFFMAMRAGLTSAEKQDVKDHLAAMIKAAEKPDHVIWGVSPPKNMSAFKARASAALFRVSRLDAVSPDARAPGARTLPERVALGRTVKARLRAERALPGQILRSQAKAINAKAAREQREELAKLQPHPRGAQTGDVFDGPVYKMSDREALSAKAAEAKADKEARVKRTEFVRGALAKGAPSFVDTARKLSPERREGLTGHLQGMLDGKFPEGRLDESESARARAVLIALGKMQGAVKRAVAPKAKAAFGKLEGYTNHSGAARGADTLWDVIGRKFGVTAHNHYRAEGNTALPPALKRAGSQAVVATKEQLDEGYKVLETVLGKKLERSLANDLKARNYLQVKNADAVFAIAELRTGKGDVKGGTNAAVQMAIYMNKPVHVWDTGSMTWHKWDGDTFVPTATPTLTKNFAGIGTRDVENYNVPDDKGGWVPRAAYKGLAVEDAARQAITDVYRKTFEKPDVGNPTSAAASAKTVELTNTVGVEDVEWVTRAEIQANPGKIYVFGDNLARRGYGGQAKEARDEPNSIGIPTKYTPTRDNAAYFGQNEALEKAEITKAVDKIIEAKASGKTIVLPKVGSAGGLADLPGRAPRVWDHLQAELNRLRAAPLGKAEVPKAKTTRPVTTLTMNYRDGSNGLSMRPEFKGKDTMDLILSGDRTATTRTSLSGFHGIKKGDVFKVEGNGKSALVRATTDPYKASTKSAEEWSKLEGWAPKEHSKYASGSVDGYQIQYELVQSPRVESRIDAAAGVKAFIVDLTSAQTKEVNDVNSALKEGAKKAWRAGKSKNEFLASNRASEHVARLVSLKSKAPAAQHAIDRAMHMVDQIFATPYDKALEDTINQQINTLHDLNSVPLKKLMGDIASSTLPGGLKAIARAVAKAVGDTEVLAERDNKDGSNGHFNMLAGKIWLNVNTAAGVAHTVLHEGVHAATLYALAADPELHKAVYALMAHVATEKPSLAGAYGMTNTLEFLAEGLSNINLQRELYKIPASSAVEKYLGKTLANAWEAFVELVRKALSLPAEHTSALTQLLELGGQAMKMTAPQMQREGNAAVDYTVATALIGRPIVPLRSVEAALTELERTPLMSASDRKQMKTHFIDQIRTNVSADGRIPHVAALSIEVARQLLQSLAARNKGRVSWGDLEDAMDVVIGDPTTILAERTGGERFNKQAPGAAFGTATSAPASQAEQERFHADIMRRLGPQMKSGLVEVLMGKNAKGKDIQLSGKWEKGAIYASVYAKNLGQVGAHEAFHEFFSRMTGEPAAVEVMKILDRAANSPYVVRQLERLLDGETEALKQIKQGAPHAVEERMAYMFQFWEAGLLQIGPETQNVFAKIAKFFRWVAGLINDDERTDMLLRSFDAGKMQTADAAARVLANSVTARQKLYQGVNGALQPMMGRVSRLVNTAETNLERTGNPAYKEIRRMFKRSVGEDGGQGFLDAKDHQMKMWSNKLAAVFEGLHPKDLALAAPYLHTGQTPKDPAVKQLVARLKGPNGLLPQMHDYLKRAGVERWQPNPDGRGGEWVPMGKIDHGYFPRAYDLTLIMNDTAAFVTDFAKYNAAELNAIAAKENEMMAAGTGPFTPMTAEDVAKAITNRLLNAFGSEVEENGSAVESGQQGSKVGLKEDKGGIGFSPFMQAINQRQLHWIHPEMLKKYGEKDVAKVLTGYVAQAVKRAEYVRRFGNGGSKLKAKLREAYTLQLDALAEKEFGPNAKDIFSTTQNEDMTDQRRIVEAALATAGQKDVAARLDALEKKALKIAGDAATDVMAMEGTLGYDIGPKMRKFQNSMVVYQNVRTLSMSLFSQFIDPLGQIVRGATMSDAWNAYKRGMRELVASIKDDPIKDLDAQIAEQVGTVDSQNFLAMFGQMYSSQYLGSNFRKANDVLFKYNGMEGFNRGMQVSATRSAINFIKRHVEKPNERSKDYLKELNLKAGDVKIDPKTGELNYANPRIQRAIHQWVNGSVLRPNAAQRPAWASDPHYMVFWHMKQFAYTFHDTIMKRAMHDYKKYGDMGPAGVLVAAYTPVMIASDAIKSLLLTGDEPTWMKAGLDSEIQHGAMRAGLAGKFQPFVDVMAPHHTPLGLGGPAIEQITEMFTDTPRDSAINALPGANVWNTMKGNEMADGHPDR